MSLIVCRKVAAEADVLAEMLARSTVVKILESEEDKNAIADIFERIEAYTKDFHVRMSMSTRLSLCSFYPSSSML
jgi:hypothetical protein